jgi:hypothetical protein
MTVEATEEQRAAMILQVEGEHIAAMGRMEQEYEGRAHVREFEHAQELQTLREEQSAALRLAEEEHIESMQEVYMKHAEQMRGKDVKHAEHLVQALKQQVSGHSRWS